MAQGHSREDLTIILELAPPPTTDEELVQAVEEELPPQGPGVIYHGDKNDKLLSIDRDGPTKGMSLAMAEAGNQVVEANGHEGPLTHEYVVRDSITPQVLDNTYYAVVVYRRADQPVTEA